MSHYGQIHTSITDQEALVRALCRVQTATGKAWTQKTIESHDKAVHLYGYAGDKRAQTANVVIRRAHVQDAANDIGFAKQADGTYTAIISEYDSSFYSQGWLKKLYTYYNVEKAKADSIAEGHKVVETVDKQGRIQLEVFFAEKKATNKAKMQSFFG